MVFLNSYATIFSNSIWSLKMRMSQILISVCLGFCFNLSANDINSSKIVYFIEHQDIPKLIQTFNETEDISFEKARICLRDVFFTIKNQYPSSKELSVYKAKEMLINYFRKELSDPFFWIKLKKASLY